MDNKKNVMCQEEYDWNKKEHLKHKNNPYMFSNEDLAVEYYQRIKKEYPDASIYYYGIEQYICLNDRSRKALLKKMVEWTGIVSATMEQLAINIKLLSDKI